MMRPRQHRNQMAYLIDEVVIDLFEKELSRIQSLTDKLILKNFQKGGDELGYIFRGKVITSNKASRTKNLTEIHPDLKDEAATLDKLYLKLREDLQKVRQGLAVIQSKCRDKQSLRDALPENIVHNLTIFRGMKRKREEGYILKEDPILYAQYKYTVDLIFYYQGNALIH